MRTRTLQNTLHFGFVLALVAGCGAEMEPISEVQDELTRAQAWQCRTLRARGNAPWYCGGIEAPLRGPLAASCPDNQWVALRLTAGAMCTPPHTSSVGTWTVSQPFAGTPGLDRYCIYRWESPSIGAAPDLALLPNQPSLRLERDCEVVAPHTRLPDGAWQPMRDAYLEQMDVPQVAALPYQRITRTAIVDSSMERVGSVGGGISLHGEAMATIVQRLSCLAGTGHGCGAQIANHLALPRIDTETYGVRGGFYGSQAELAVAMHRAMTVWQSDTKYQAGDHIVLNLSVGWNGLFDGAPSPDMRLPARLAYETARFATCEGALLIAAAGNRSTDSSSGPLYPAAWEAETRACSTAPANAYDPLVHAVGGVDGRDQILSLSRENAQPRLVAPASQVNLRRAPLVSTPTQILSGTSISAAGVSAIASVVWSLRNDLEPWQVMQIVYDSAMPVGGAADFGYQGSLQARRRVSMCRAVELACANIACPPLPACENRPAGVDATADFATAMTVAYPGLDAPQNASNGTETTDAQDADVFMTPWVVPQPDVDPCPLCGLIGDGLYGQIDPALAQSANIMNATLVVQDVQDQEIKVGLDIPDPMEPFFTYVPELSGHALVKGKIELTTDEKGVETVRVSELFVKP